MKLPPSPSKTTTPVDNAASTVVTTATVAIKPPGKPPTIKPKASPVSAHVPKTFAVQAWTGKSEGQKIALYSKSGGGKTTAAAQIKGAVFLGIDDGGKQIGTNPITGEPLQHIAVESFSDVRDALHQTNLWPSGSTVVIDTITKLEELAEPYIFNHYPLKNGKAASMRAYGWDGPAHQLDVLRLIMSDCETLVRRGVNIVILAQLAQIRVANAGGIDYLEDGPKLQHNNQYSSRTELCEWSDHVLRIGYQEFGVEKDNDKARVGKVQASDATRAIFSGGAQHFIAKSRPINGYRIPAVVSFDSPEDNSLWKFILEGARAE